LVRCEEQSLLVYCCVHPRGCCQRFKPQAGFKFKPQAGFKFKPQAGFKFKPQAGFNRDSLTSACVRHIADALHVMQPAGSFQSLGWRELCPLKATASPYTRRKAIRSRFWSPSFIASRIIHQTLPSRSRARSSHVTLPRIRQHQHQHQQQQQHRQPRLRQCLQLSTSTLRLFQQWSNGELLLLSSLPDQSPAQFTPAKFFVFAPLLC
jgi:hypothetical protein